jgi:hypothetical protein
MGLWGLEAAVWVFASAIAGQALQLVLQFGLFLSFLPFGGDASPTKRALGLIFADADSAL